MCFCKEEIRDRFAESAIVRRQGCHGLSHIFERSISVDMQNSPSHPSGLGFGLQSLDVVFVCSHVELQLFGTMFTLGTLIPSIILGLHEGEHTPDYFGVIAREVNVVRL